METIERNLYEFQGYAPIGLQDVLQKFESGEEIGEINNKVGFFTKLRIEQKFRAVIHSYQREQINNMKKQFTTGKTVIY
jgi:hypothetical protein